MFEFGWLTGKGRTPEKACWLNWYTIPAFLRVCGQYEVVHGPKFIQTSMVGDDICLYGVRDIKKKGIVFYLKCPFENLPKEFRVSKIITDYPYYEFIPLGDDHAWRPRYPITRREAIHRVPEILVAH